MKTLIKILIGMIGIIGIGTALLTGCEQTNEELNTTTTKNGIVTEVNISNGWAQLITVEGHQYLITTTCRGAHSLHAASCPCQQAQ